MIYIAVFVSFLTVLILLYSVLLLLYKSKMIMDERIGQIESFNNNSVGNDDKTSLNDRIITPLYQSLNRMYLKFTPNYKVQLLNKRLERAGVLKNISSERWMFKKTIFVLTISAIFAILSYFIDPSILKSLAILLMMIILVNGFIRFYLSRKITLRNEAIRRDLPYTLDLVTVSVEAGLSFDGAIAKVVNTIKGELSNEFSKTLKEMRMGIEKKVALKNMSERCDLRELSMLITSLIQADELGISLGKVLRIEASGLRESMKQAAREKAMKAPVKMLFPLIFFIFPAIFVIILGPALIQMMEIF